MVNNFYLLFYFKATTLFFHVLHNVHNKLIYDMKLQLDEKEIRMKVAMTLLLGTHSHYKGDLIRNAELTWHDCICGKH